jgi:hypothetical protein
MRAKDEEITKKLKWEKRRVIKETENKEEHKKN